MKTPGGGPVVGVLGSGHRRPGRRKFLPLERPSGARIITNPQPTARGRYRTVTIQAAIKSRPNGGQPSHDLVVEEAKPKLRKPPMYQVVMLNDDYTPMEFVVDVLESFFGMDRELAVRVMLKVHTEGRAVCGVFTRDIAESKAIKVNRYARENEHPLICEIEPADDPE